MTVKVGEVLDLLQHIFLEDLAGQAGGGQLPLCRVWFEVFVT